MNVPQTRTDYVPATNESNPYTAYGEAATQSRIVGHLLKFTKFGEFEAGENNTIIQPGTELIAHMGELLVGWQRWQDNKPTDQVMGLVRENFQPPRRSELGDMDHSLWEVDDTGKERDPWQLTNMLILKGLDNDELYTFSTASRGGIQSIGRLCKEYGKAMRMRPDQFPVVRLGWDSYQHSNKQFGEIRFPVFEIVGWVPRDEIDKALAGGDAVEADSPQPEEPPVEQPPPNPPRQPATRQAAPQRQAPQQSTQQRAADTTTRPATRIERTQPQQSPKNSTRF